MFSKRCIYPRIHPRSHESKADASLFDSFHSESPLPSALSRERETSSTRDVLPARGRARRYRPDGAQQRKSVACFAFLHSRVSFGRRFLRMNKPGLHPPAAARHPLPGAQSSLAAGKLLVCPPTSLFSRLPPGSSSSSSSVDVACRRNSSTLHSTGQLWRCSRCPNSPQSASPLSLVDQMTN